ncbi:phytoene/squalene synthase family protein [Pseudohoeflea suaedae]|uniref:Phytoene/squalene synthase family protein n=1 Tax=Pseudohoeflea suaedae TaxID=877384 RepID=A0A4R5PRH1_9HYPH|nr:phytoene/squalene synthase family protein [Pseudohoeflea suaedae]TDH39197.1 phytoene/squalene synthase family protein [Pseudohoeflea suaedae]
MADLARLRDELRSVDRDRYLACLLLPEAVQADVAALYLFNAEIAAIRDRIREAIAGEIRLQWWRDALSGERSEEVAANPTATALIEMIDRRNLPREPFLGMLEAREFDLYDDPMPDRGAYEAYAGHTASVLIQMTAMILDPDSSQSYAEAAGHAGVAQSVAGHLMLLPVHTSRGQVFLPGDLLSATGLERESFLAQDRTESLGAAISGFVAFGREHLAKARESFEGLPQEGRGAFLPVATADLVFRRAGKAGAAALSRAVQPSLLARQWQMWRFARRNTL